MKYKFLIALILVFLNVSFAAENPITEYDLRSYRPQDMGLKDLVVDFRIEGILEALNNEKIFGKLTDVYFRLYWEFPDKYYVEVNGLPAGYNERKRELGMTVFNYLEYIIPSKWESKTAAYTLTTEKDAEGIHVKAADKTGKLNISQMDFLFETDGRIKRLKTLAPTGSQQVTFDAKTYSWSKNKWVTDKVTVEIGQGFQKVQIENQISYKDIAGIGLPTSFIVKTTREVPAPANQKEKTQKIELISKMMLSNHEVNSGKASKFFMTLRNASQGGK